MEDVGQVPWYYVYLLFDDLQFRTYNCLTAFYHDLVPYDWRDKSEVVTDEIKEYVIREFKKAVEKWLLLLKSGRFIVWDNKRCTDISYWGSKYDTVEKLIGYKEKE